MYCRAFGSGAVTIFFYDLGLSRMGFEHPTFRLRANPRRCLCCCYCCCIVLLLLLLFIVVVVAAAVVVLLLLLCCCCGGGGGGCNAIPK